ncbi:MAG: hypothetical protein RIT27_2343 [Pseudomonadota bacterium]|jgi:streptogramin lyase
MHHYHLPISTETGGVFIIATHKFGFIYTVLGDGKLYRRDRNDEKNNWLPISISTAKEYGIEYLFVDESTGDIYIAYWVKEESEYIYRVVSFSAENHSVKYDFTHKFPTTSIYVDKTGGLWIATYGGGLGYLSSEGKDWKVFSENQGLKSNYVTAMQADDRGNLWIGTGDYSGWQIHGLTRLKPGGKWENFVNSALPSNRVGALESDGNGGVWVGTQRDMVRIYADGRWESFDPDSEYYNDIVSISKDKQGGLWIGTYGQGIFYRDSTGKMKNINTKNSNLPSDTVGVDVDNSGAVWVNTARFGIARLVTDSQFDIFNTSNSFLPSNYNIFFKEDNSGNLWVAMGAYLERDLYGDLVRDDVGNIIKHSGAGLLYRDSQGTWSSVINTSNSPLPSNDISALVPDKKGGVWIGTEKNGIAHYKANGQWEVFNTANSKLVGNSINAMSLDDRGGLWIASADWYETDSKGNSILDENKNYVISSHSGLVYLDSAGNWTVIDNNNAKLPASIIRLLPDDKGGVWIGTWGGLVHLTFTNKTGLCQQGTQQNCSALQNNKRGAIVIAGGGTQGDNILWDTTNNVSNTIYRTLTKRGFDNDEIYYLSPTEWADFNGDGINDRIVDAPKADRGLEAGDIQKALEWAKQRGKLDQPLYIFFVDHGGEDKLQLSKDNTLPVEQFKQMLDDYQTTTGNEVVLVIDACFSGVLGEKLKANKRAIITSAGNNSAYFNRLDKQGFSSFLMKGLSQARNFNEAFDFAKSEQKKLLSNMDLRVAVTGSTGSSSGVIEQTPRKFDGNQTYSLDKLFLNGSFVTGDATLSVKNITTSTQIKANIPFNLKAQASVAQGNVDSVWAVVRPPRMDLILDSYNTPILAFPRVILSSTNVNNEWEGTLSNTRYNGDYKITFYAKDRDGDVASSDDTITLSVSDGIEPPPQANLQIQLNQTHYKAGDVLKATITEELQWGYDLYLAIILPSGDFITLKAQNSFSNLNEIKTWYGNRSQGITNPFLELTLPALPAGQYCLFGALSPEGEPPLNAQKYWKQTTQCFTMN